MDTIDSFYQELRQIVARRASSSHLVDVLAFTEEISERLQEDPVFGEYRHAEIHDRLGKNTFRLHGYTELDESDGSIGLIVSRWSDSDTPETLTSAEIAQMTGWLETFAKGAIEGKISNKIVESNEAYELATTLENSRRISRIRLHLLSNSKLSQRFKEDIVGQISGLPVERHIWDLLRIKSLYESSREREAIEIDLSEFGSRGINCLKASDAEGMTSYLCVVSANLLADMFERYGSRLLEGNVRSFLGMKGGVNKGIRATIQDAPGRFFAYNNGIAATATNISLSASSEGTVITRVVDLQIVNGGQTTASILSARKKDGLSLDGVTVQMKLTEVEPSIGNQMIPLIAKFANTQNKVAVADFFANHPVHRKLEEISRRLRTPLRAGVRIESKWFYERSRGQYQNERLYLAKNKRDLFDLEYPSSQVINKTDLAKYDSALNLKPWWIAQGAQKNFAKFASQFTPHSETVTESEYWDSISPRFGEAYYQKMISIAIIWRHMESMISDARGEWYEGDYRAQIAAYAISLFFKLYKDRSGGFDLQNIWLAQAVPDDLRKPLTEIAQNVQHGILSPPQGTTNVGEWTKKEECWTRLKDISISWDSSLAEYYVSDGHLRQQAISEKKAGEVDDGISLQGKVLELVTSGYWRALYMWASNSKHFTPSEVTLISKASTITGFTRIALERDWRKLLEIKATAESEGFRHKQH
jgi:hypothetical protein